MAWTDGTNNALRHIDLFMDLYDRHIPGSPGASISAAPESGAEYRIRMFRDIDAEKGEAS
jgi:hypothetical protein